MSTTFGHANNAEDDDDNKNTQQRLGRQSPPEHSSEWDSDIDDSSEEFEYVKGTDHQQPKASVNGADADGHDDGNTTKRVENLGTIGEEEVWNAHADKIPVAVTATTKGTEARFSCNLFSRSRNDTVSFDLFSVVSLDDGDDGKSDGDDDDKDSCASSSEAEGEWVPSCWDSMAQPVRSALKSPDKTSSVSICFVYGAQHSCN